MSWLILLNFVSSRRTPSLSLFDFHTRPSPPLGRERSVVCIQQLEHHHQLAESSFSVHRSDNSLIHVQRLNAPSKTVSRLILLPEPAVLHCLERYCGSEVQPHSCTRRIILSMGFCAFFPSPQLGFALQWVQEFPYRTRDYPGYSRDLRDTLDLTTPKMLKTIPGARNLRGVQRKDKLRHVGRLLSIWRLVGDPRLVYRKLEAPLSPGPRIGYSCLHPDLSLESLKVSYDDSRRNIIHILNGECASISDEFPWASVVPSDDSCQKSGIANAIPSLKDSSMTWCSSFSKISKSLINKRRVLPEGFSTRGAHGYFRVLCSTL